MKKVIKCMILILMLCVMQLPMITHGKTIGTSGEYVDSVIGGEYDVSEDTIATRTIRANILPNVLEVDYDATATSIILKFTNIGLDSIDSVSGTVTAGSQQKSFSLTMVKPGTTSHTVTINMLQCHEEISVYTIARDGGDGIGSSTTPGERNIPSNLLSQWHDGGRGSAENNLNYHFSKHHSGLGISNIVSYANSAQSFRSNLSGATSSPVSGITPNVTRWIKNGKYIDICGSKNIGLIISYGKQ